MTAATAVQFTTKTGKPSLRKPSRFVSLMLKNDEGATLMTLFERLPTGELTPAEQAVIAKIKGQVESQREKSAARAAQLAALGVA
jgi:hypothetical protein